jgi:hypothetical protein
MSTETKVAPPALKCKVGDWLCYNGLEGYLSAQITEIIDGEFINVQMYWHCTDDSYDPVFSQVFHISLLRDDGLLCKNKWEVENYPRNYDPFPPMKNPQSAEALGADFQFCCLDKTTKDTNPQ